MLIAFLTFWISSLIAPKTFPPIEFKSISKSFQKNIADREKILTADSLLIDYENFWLQSTKKSDLQIQQIIESNQDIFISEEELEKHFDLIDSEFEARKTKRIENHLQLLQILDEDEWSAISEELLTYSPKGLKRLDKYISGQQSTIDQKTKKLNATVEKLVENQSHKEEILKYISRFNRTTKRLIAMQKLTDEQLATYKKYDVTKEELMSLDTDYTTALQHSEYTFLKLRWVISTKCPPDTWQKITQEISKLLESSL
ncbi:hypothetical protein [Sediminitomix flava]|uniref:Uncharacterized protein n=1 Tax=Sediminitomix flava TaxID=379075 RepID=A0A315ZG39_SEDFL|nr:hypothetical protein [Sediminitomix flava]PWJ44556.1 hypothetical protein BC781_101927 [Sediminitomix flava]